jgi:hypothetical protein
MVCEFLVLLSRPRGLSRFADEKVRQLQPVAPPTTIVCPFPFAKINFERLRVEQLHEAVASFVVDTVGRSQASFPRIVKPPRKRHGRLRSG